jgi:hypothetical protein
MRSPELVSSPEVRTEVERFLPRGKEYIPTCAFEAFSRRGTLEQRPQGEDSRMTERIRILFLSANPWTTGRILVDEEAREIFEKLQEGSHRDEFELIKHEAIRALDLQRLLMMHQPHIVHFSGHGSRQHKIILGGAAGRGKEVDRQGLVDVFGLYKHHVRLVVLNACFTKTQARALSEVIDYSVGTGKGMGDKGGVAFAGAFYRALGFGKSVKEAFESAKAELALTKTPRTRGIELFVRKGVTENDPFPQKQSDLSDGVPWGLLADSFARQSSGCEMFFDEASPHQTSGLGAKTSKAQIPSNRALEHRFFQQTYVEHTDRHGPLLQAETTASVVNPAAEAGKRPPVELSCLRGARHTKTASEGRGKVLVQPASSKESFCTMALTVKVERVVLIEVTRVSQTQVVREDQAGRSGPRKKSAC